MDITSVGMKFILFAFVQVISYSILTLVSACIIASVIGVLSVFLIAFFCFLEAEDIPHEPHETEVLTRNLSPIPGCSTSDSMNLMCTAV